jgi:hypothetical protein
MPPLPPAAPIVTPPDPELEEFEALYLDLARLKLPLPNSTKLIEQKRAAAEKAKVKVSKSAS